MQPQKEKWCEKHGLFSVSVVCKSGFTFISANCNQMPRAKEPKTDNRNCIKITKEREWTVNIVQIVFCIYLFNVYPVNIYNL